MPTVELSFKDLKKLLRKNISFEELEERGILFAKGEIDSVEGDIIKVDIKDTNRPDLWSVEGIARELRSHYGVEAGVPKYTIKKSGIKMLADKKVKKVRPCCVGAVVKGLKFDNEIIKQTIQLQEKIALTYGRNRALVAIGVYDYDRIVPPVRYTTTPPEGIKFTPLDFKEEMTPKEILERHPKGILYGHLINKFPEYPLMIDSVGNVLSIPPIINSAYTGKITEATKNVFIELTGYEIKRLSVALNVLVTALADRGGEIESVEVVYPKEKITTPDLTPGRFVINPEECTRITGLKLSDREIIKLLKNARYNTKMKGRGKTRKILVEYPAYRNDVMHQRDVIEDIAIAYDINKIIPEMPEISTIGKENEREEFAEVVRELMIGLGFQEVLTFSLTNKENLFKKMNLEEQRICEIANPVSTNWNALRSWLLPSLVEFLTKNMHVSYPQQIFEVGDVIEIDETKETMTVTKKKLACAITDNILSYENISSVLDAFLNSIGIKYELKSAAHGSFIAGRTAEVIVDGKAVGVIGEVHPLVLNNWKLEKPLVAFEIGLDEIK